MKLWTFLLSFMILVSAKGQSRVFFPKSDSCTTYTLISTDSTLVIREVDRCANYSSIQQVTADRSAFSRNGYYQVFFDTCFKSLKQAGYFVNGIETGVWKHYYENGNIQFVGSCSPILVGLSK